MRLTFAHYFLLARRPLYRASLAGLIVLLAGCAASGPTFKDEPTPSRDTSLVYIYRPYASNLGLVTAAFAVDGKTVAELSPGGYEAISLSPGEHEIVQTWITTLPGSYKEMKEPLKTRVRLRPGATHYVQFQVATESRPYVTRISWKLGEVNAIEGRTAITETRRQSVKALSN